ncbi:EamA domain [Dillenia turbinata]|uniref:WAT1-related protein n=1 Tax=Dillenia turbinata TaxID=194707 RepID=A0AAN8VVL0_9MAGN
MGAKKWYEGSEAVLSMLLVQAFATGLQLLSRVILNEGTFVFALMTYRHIVAALCVFPFAFFLERGNAKKMNWRVLFWLFLNALTGVQMAMGFFYYGLHDTTAVYATSLLNTVPVLTFVLTTITRVEKLNLHTKAGKIKLLGAVFSFAGALTTTLYKGKGFHIGNQKLKDHPIVINFKADWLRGTFFLAGSCCSYATWFLVQLKLSKIFPSKYWTTLMTCVIASVQSAILGFGLNRDLRVWKLEWNLQLITIFYSLERNIIGMCLIIVGLYSFLWGKNNDPKSLPSAAELSTPVIPESAGPRLSATVVPTNPPCCNNIDTQGRGRIRVA